MYGNAGVWNQITTWCPPAIGFSVMAGCAVMASTPLMTAGSVPLGFMVGYGTRRACESIRQKEADKNLKEKLDVMDTNSKNLLIDVSGLFNDRNKYWNYDKSSFLAEHSMDEYKVVLKVESYASMKTYRFYESDNVVLGTNADDTKAYLYLDNGKYAEPLMEMSYDWEQKAFPKKRFQEALHIVVSGDKEKIEECRFSPDKPKDIPLSVAGTRKVVNKLPYKEEEKVKRNVVNPFDLTPSYEDRERDSVKL